VPSLPTVLQARGWTTAAFLSSFTVSEFYGFDNGFDLFDNGLQVPADQSFQRGKTGIWDWPLRSNQRRADETTARAVRWLNQVKPPFFAWVHYWDPHDTALLPPTEYLQRFLRPGQSEDERRRATYAAEVAFLDAQFGRVIRKLQERGFYDRTIIVVVADHGEGLGDHDWWFHRVLYQEQIRVPLILCAPGWPAGGIVPELVRTTDIFATVLELLAVEMPQGIEGRSLRGLVFGESEAPRIAYADAINLYDLNAKLLNRRPDDGLVYAAMDHEWKLIHRPHLEGKDELYHIADDPVERMNLVESHPDQVGRLLSRLRAYDGFVTRPFGEAADPAVLERLRSLGYIGD
jgi:arylsulfatase A-like enzyme